MKFILIRLANNAISAQFAIKHIYKKYRSLDEFLKTSQSYSYAYVRMEDNTHKYDNTDFINEEGFITHIPEVNIFAIKIITSPNTTTEKFGHILKLSQSVHRHVRDLFKNNENNIRMGKFSEQGINNFIETLNAENKILSEALTEINRLIDQYEKDLNQNPFLQWLKDMKNNRPIKLAALKNTKNKMMSRQISSPKELADEATKIMRNKNVMYTSCFSTSRTATFFAKYKSIVPPKIKSLLPVARNASNN